MQCNQWMTAALAGLMLAGCTTVDKAPAGRPGQAGTAPARSSYQLAQAVGKGQAGGARQFFLVRQGEQWQLAFDENAFAAGAGERLAYWPQEKKVAFVFDSARRPADNGDMCDNDTRDRAKAGYTVCSSAFRVADNSGSTVFARAFVGVATGGASEIIYAGKGARFERIDQAEVLAVLERLGLERQVWLRDYRERAALATVSGQNDFIRRYERDDPEQLLPKARALLKTLAANAGILEQAERATPAAARYAQRFMPANPRKYCNALKADAEDFRYCQGAASEIVAALAASRGAAARRTDLCLAVARAAGAGAQSATCQGYGAGACSASTPKGQQVCDILNRKGQS